MTPVAVRCPPCAEAEHPLEHRACTGEACVCRCRTMKTVRDPLVYLDRAPVSDQHEPMRMLDIAEVTVGCWVNWRRSEEAEGEARGGVVVGIDHLVDDETGETRRVFHTARLWAGRIRWDRISEADVGSIDVPSIHIVRSLWRAMGAEVGKKRGTARPEELRLGETIHLLQRSLG